MFGLGVPLPGLGRAGAFLRYDAALLSGDPRHGQNTFTLGVDWKL